MNEMSEPEPPVALPQGAWPEENTPTPPAQEAPQWNDAWGQQEAPQMPPQPPYQVPFPDGTDMSFQGTGAPAITRRHRRRTRCGALHRSQ